VTATATPKGSLPTQRADYRHWTVEQVRWSDTDMVGHVNNGAFVVYAETGRTHFLRPLFDEGPEHRAMFLLARITVNFFGELHWPARVDIGSGVLTIGRTSMAIGQGLFDGERCFGSAESIMVMIDETTRKPCEIPDWARARLAGFHLNASSI
jgi:acyl-CoA thioester hydrolase